MRTWTMTGPSLSAYTGVTMYAPICACSPTDRNGVERQHRDATLTAILRRF